MVAYWLFRILAHKMVKQLNPHKLEQWGLWLQHMAKVKRKEQEKVTKLKKKRASRKRKRA